MFVRFLNRQAAKCVGLIVSIYQRGCCHSVPFHVIGSTATCWAWNHEQHVFLTHQCAYQSSISLWYRCNHYDSGCINSFYINDPMLPLVQGIRDTFQVSFVVFYCWDVYQPLKNIFSLPSFWRINLLSTCFASSLFKELMVLQKKVQCFLNTCSMNGECSQICHINNINFLTWLYIIRNLPCELVHKNVIMKCYYIADNEAVLKKTRATQQSFELTIPDHLIFAQMPVWKCCRD